MTMLFLREEARHCPDIVVADIDVKAFNDQQTVKIKEVF